MSVSLKYIIPVLIQVFPIFKNMLFSNAFFFVTIFLQYVHGSKMGLNYQD